ncbi:hypothetical protein CC1G_10522 [Coprinopsis cinerea okayama7|uniref:Uncharacterized protein n=1 Tax=Coprinopsis cinerea (strain Okayama-7 / 130 / ATCC MYA-4618 / FGSC 9003) TaxID=240176 RepID=A8N1A1_COPC7|nr:hypothetical protein CC1G_10522 [Coprinopsis cinerea okayama7\|eukprot:XP_001828650.2 hypothetical protein CC1G_10522 [Coprinopsis cinerea okayama7\
MFASAITSYFMPWFEEPVDYSWSFFRIVSPLDVARDLITAAFQILRDSDVGGILEDDGLPPPTPRFRYSSAYHDLSQSRPGIVMRFLRRFLLGLPLVGAVSIVHLLLSFQALAPVHWLARYRGARRRNGNDRDIATLIVVALIVAGSARALYKIYQKIEEFVRSLLTMAEDAILEVNG